MKPDSVRGALVFTETAFIFLCRGFHYGVSPLGGVSVQPPADAGTGQAAESGERERGGSDTPETRTAESSKPNVNF